MTTTAKYLYFFLNIHSKVEQLEYKVIILFNIGSAYQHRPFKIPINRHRPILVYSHGANTSVTGQTTPSVWTRDVQLKYIREVHICRNRLKANSISMISTVWLTGFLSSGVGRNVACYTGTDLSIF